MNRQQQDLTAGFLLLLAFLKTDYDVLCALRSVNIISIDPAILALNRIVPFWYVNIIVSSFDANTDPSVFEESLTDIQEYGSSIFLGGVYDPAQYRFLSPFLLIQYTETDLSSISAHTVLTPACELSQ